MEIEESDDEDDGKGFRMCPKCGYDVDWAEYGEGMPGYHKQHISELRRQLDLELMNDPDVWGIGTYDNLIEISVRNFQKKTDIEQYMKSNFLNEDQELVIIIVREQTKAQS